MQLRATFLSRSLHQHPHINVHQETQLLSVSVRSQFSNVLQKKINWLVFVQPKLLKLINGKINIFICSDLKCN